MSDHEYLPLDSAERGRLYRRLLLRGVLLIITLVALSFGLPRILPLISPFLFALVVAMALNPIVTKIEKNLHINRRISAFILTFIVVGLLVFILVRLIYTIVGQSILLATNIDTVWSYAANSIDFLNEKLDRFMGVLPSGNNNTLDVLKDNIYSWLQTISGEIMDSALSFITNTTSKVSSIFVAVIMALLAVYFTVADYPKLSTFTKKHIDRHAYSFLRKIKRAIQSAFGGYLKAQLLLALLAFVVMFVALGIYGQKYSLIIALGLGIVDFLPIVGTIAVLVPWAVIEFLSGDMYKAIFLLILAIGFFLLRKIVEPKIVGSQTGLHPVVALLSIYAGMKVYGVWGAIFGPVIVMIVINIVKSGIFEDTIADLKDLYQIGRSALKRSSE